MLRVTVLPAPMPAPPLRPLGSAPTRLPPSPYAFFAENEVLRVALRALSSLLTAYCIAMVTLLSDADTCTGIRTSFYCEPRLGTTRFALVVRNVHLTLAVLFGLSAWHLRSPRRCFVLLNVAVCVVSGMALVALGVSQCVGASLLPRPASSSTTVTVLVGVQLILLGLVTGVGGGCVGWRYHRRRTIEMLVVVDMLWSTQ